MGAFAVSCLCQFHFVMGMVFEISKSLGIYVFFVKPKVLEGKKIA